MADMLHHHLTMQDLLKASIILGTIYMVSALAAVPFTPDEEPSLEYACMHLDSLTEQERFDYQFKLDSQPGYEIQLEEFCNP